MYSADGRFAAFAIQLTVFSNSLNAELVQMSTAWVPARCAKIPAETPAETVPDAPSTGASGTRV